MNAPAPAKAALAAFLLASTPAVFAAPSNLTVTVTNTPSNPVPVTGNVNLANTPSVRDADNAARHAFQAFVEVEINAGSNSASGVVTTVPAGQVLVIETVDAIAGTPVGQKALVYLRPCAPDCVEHQIALTAQGTFNTQELFTATHAVRFYATAGTEVLATMKRDNTPSLAGMKFSISGYLLDVAP